MRERLFTFTAVLVAALSAIGAPVLGQGTCNLPAPGAARPWEASIDVATYSSVNVRNGNLLTVVPVVGWSGVGPDVSFAFVHNSAHVDSGVDLDHTTGFNLGEGWQSTYSARLIFNRSTSTTVVHNDGRMDTYTKVSGVWNPPAGVHDVLEQHTVTPKWTLTFKDQSRLNFNTLGRLSGVEDAHGNLLSLTRDNNYKLLKITDAAGRKLLFEYDNENRLARIIDLKAGGCWPAEDCDCECGMDCECEGGEVMVQVATTWYVYEGTDPAQNKDEGNPVRIITEEAADPGVYSATRFVYDKAQRVWLMFGETWEEDGKDKDECPDNDDITWAREFRYDAARARYLNRELDIAELLNGDLVPIADGDTWTDYGGAAFQAAGDSAYGDWEFNANDPPTPDNLRSYEPGLALKDPWDETSGIEYVHGDLIGSTPGPGRMRRAVARPPGILSSVWARMR
ncbi:MAG: hypothetical protein BroJett003_17140 [Planctomycetota bacterium]|nr:MAG: hypothetical protein BroJett003_17140 [Planctomycetota bacterium]